MGMPKPMTDTCARLIDRLPNLRVDCNEPPWSLDFIQKKKILKWEFNAYLKILIKVQVLFTSVQPTRLHLAFSATIFIYD